MTSLALSALLVVAIAASTPEQSAVYCAVVDRIAGTLRGVRSVRFIVEATTVPLTLPMLERLVLEGPKDDPPEAMKLAKKEAGFEQLLAASSKSVRVPHATNWRIAEKEPDGLSCKGVNWELEREVFVRFSAPVFVNTGKALVYAYVKDCISFGHDIIILEKRGKAWEMVMSYQIAGAGE